MVSDLGLEPRLTDSESVEDSFTPSEFDLTPYIQDQGNVLAVRVYKRSTAAFIEDQDMFRFSGIFRDVNILAEPASHITDFGHPTSSKCQSQKW